MNEGRSATLDAPSILQEKTTPFARVTFSVRELLTGTRTRFNDGIILKQV